MAFDPTQPFSVLTGSDEEQQSSFDPSQPFDVLAEGDEEGERFTPSPEDLRAIELMQSGQLPADTIRPMTLGERTVDTARAAIEDPGAAITEPLLKVTEMAPSRQEIQDAFDVLTAQMVVGTPEIPSEEAYQRSEELMGGPSQAPGPAAQATQAAIKVGLGVPEFMTSPLGIATLGQGMLPQALQRGVSGAFAVDMARHIPEQAQAAGEASVMGDVGQQVEAFGNLGIGALMAGATARHALTPRVPSIELPPEIRQAESAGLTRSAAAARAKVEQQALEPAPIPERRTADAQQNREATEVHGPVREQPIEGQRQVSTEEGGTGVRPQGQDQVLLNDIQRYSELDAEIATLRSGRNAIEAMSDPRMMEVMREQQQIKNRHGGHKPQDIVPIDPAVAELRDLPGTSTTQEAMAIGARVAPESRAQLEELVRTSADEANKVIAEVDAIPNPTEADLSRMSVAGNRAQLMSEALEASRGGKPAMLERQEVIPDAQKEVQTQGPDVLTESTVAEGISSPAIAGAPKAAVSTPEQGRAAAAAKVIADKLREQFKTPETGAELGTFGVVPKVINAAVELAAQVIEKGGSAIDGINEAVAYIRKNHTGYFNEQEFRSFAQRAVTPAKPEVAGTGGQGVSGAGDFPARSVQGNQMRKSAQRATTSPDIPEPVQERIAAAPESRYEPQSMRAVEESVARMSEGELAAVARESDLYTASRLELAQRRFKAGDNEGGYKVFEELEKEGTRFGQLINQFKLLAGTQPENIVRVVNEKLTRSGKDRLTPAQEAKMLETSRRSKASDAALDKATQEWVNNPTAENARAAEAQLDAANLSALELQQLVNKFQPKTLPGTLKSILQGNLLTPISEVANLVGNTSFLPFRAATRGSAAFIDMVDAAIRGKPREISAQPLSGTIQAARGAVRGLKEIPSILKEGTGNVIKGETRAGLHPIKAWVNQFAKNPDMPTTGGRLSLGDRLNLALEGTFGIPAEIMLRGLGAGDAPFRKAAEARVITEQLKLAGVPRAQWDFAQKFPELFFDRAKLEQIRNDAAGAIFQGRSSSLDTLNRFIRNNWLTQRGVSPDWIDLAVSTVAPYRLTPWKITGEILSYNPIVAMGRTLFEAKKGNSRSAKLNAGKFVIGSMLTGGAYWLYNKGLLAPSMDERSEAQKARVLAGEILPPNHINVSGLKRALEGGDPAFRKGDETVDVFRGGGLAGAMMYLVANIGREFERKPEEAQSDMFGSILRQSTLEQARFAMNQSYLSGVEGLLTAIKDGNTDNWFRQWSGTLLSIPLPNTLSTLSRATRQYKPDVKSDTFKKGVENIVRTRLGFAGLDDYMPLKRGLWGEPLPETPKDRNAFFYHFFDISKNKQVTDDPVPLELYRLWRRTGDTKAIPSLPEKRMTVASRNYPLTPELQSRYAELIGAERRRIVDRLVVNPFFQSRNDEQKIKILDRAYREGHERGKVMFWRENGDKLTAAPDKAGF